MKKFSLLTAATLLMTSHAAFAACELEPAAPVPVPATAIGKTVVEAISPDYFNALKARLPGCSEAEIVEAFLAANNWQPDTRLQEGATIRAVRLKTVTPAPVAAVAPAPKPAVSPAEVTQVREEQTRVREERANVQTQNADLERAVQTFLKNNPVRVEWTAAQTKSFNDAQAKLAGYGRQIAALQGKVSSLKTAMGQKADKTYVDTALKGKANVGDSYTKAEVDTMFNELPAGESLPRWAPWWLIAILGVLGLIGAILGVLAFVRKPPATGTDMGGVADVLMRADLDALKQEVGEVRATVESVKDQAGLPDIRFGEGQREALDTLPEGETLSVDVIVEGEKKFSIRFKRVENGLFIFDELKSRFKSINPTIPFKSPISSICRNYKHGEFTGLVLSAVSAAA